MFKFLKSNLGNEEKKIFDVTLRPYIIYSIINITFMGLASHGVGILNEDVFGGLLISWLIYTFTFLITTIRVE